MFVTLLIRRSDLNPGITVILGGNSAKGEFRQKRLLHGGHALTSIFKEDLDLIIKESIRSHANRAEDLFNPGFKEGGTMNGLGEAEAGEDATIGVESVGFGEGMGALGEG